MQRVSKKAVLMWTARSMTKWLGLAVLILWFVSGDVWLYFGPQKNLSGIMNNAIAIDRWIFFGLSIVLLFLIFSSISNAFYKYWSIGYATEESDLKIVKGFIIKHETYIPYQNIDSVDIHVGSTERLWGLASILVFTAGAQDKENPEAAAGYLEGLKYDNAVVLKDELLQKINKNN